MLFCALLFKNSFLSLSSPHLPSLSLCFNSYILLPTFPYSYFASFFPFSVVLCAFSSFFLPLCLSFTYMMSFAWVVEQFPAMNNIIDICFHIFGGASSGYIPRNRNAGQKFCQVVINSLPPASSNKEGIVKLLNCCQSEG